MVPTGLYGTLGAGVRLALGRIFGIKQHHPQSLSRK